MKKVSNPPEGPALSPSTSLRINSVEGLTQRQQDVLTCIRQYRERYGRAPLLREIAKALGLESYRSLAKYVQALRERGFLHQERGWRNLRTVDDMVTLPLLGTIRAGRPQMEAEDASFLRVPHHLVKDLRRPDSGYVLRVSGNSMTPLFEPGDLVLVDRTRPPKDGDVVIALVDDTDNTLKTLRRSSSGEWVLVAENKTYAPLVASSMRSLHIQGVVLRKLTIGN